MINMTPTALQQAIADGHTGAAVTEVIRRCADGEDAIAVARELLAVMAVAHGDWLRLTVALADALRVCQTLEPGRRGLPLAQIVAAMVDVLRVRFDGAPATIDDGADASLSDLLAALCERAEYLAHLAAPIAALAELQDLCRPDAVQPLINRTSALVATSCEPAVGTAAAAEHIARLGLLDDQWQRLFDAADAEKESKFQEPKFRKHLVDGTAENGFRAMAKALAFGVPRHLLAGSVGLAASERALRFDASLQDDARFAEGWTDAVHSFELAAATVRVLRRHEGPSWARLLLTGAWVANSGGALDAAVGERYALPQPEAIAQTWDHGPEIAKLQARLLRRDLDGAIAVLRGYLMMVLPVQPLCQQLAAVGFEDIGATSQAQLLASGALSAGVEIFSALGDHPHRELALCAAIRLATAPLCPRQPHRAGLAAIDAREGIAAAQSRAIRLWTLHG